MNDLANSFASPSTNINQIMQATNRFLGQFLQQEKEDARQAWHREVDLLVDNLFDKMSTKLNRIILSGGLTSHFMPHTSLLDSISFPSQGPSILSTPFQRPPPVVNPLLQPSQPTAMMNNNFESNLNSHSTPNNSVVASKQKASTQNNKPSPKKVQVKKEVEQLLIELDQFPVSDKPESTKNKNPTGTTQAQTSNSNDSVFTSSLASKISENDNSYFDEDEEDCDCYECVNEVFKCEEDNEDSCQVIDLDNEDSLDSIRSCHSGEHATRNKRKRVSAPVDPNFATTSSSTSSSTHDNSKNQKHAKKSHQSPFPLGNAQDSSDGHQSSILITMSMNCIVDNCSAVFETMLALDQHLQQVHHILPNRCLVPGCNQSFYSRGQLSQHILLHHGDISSWQCAKCSTHCKNYNGLYQHIRWSHYTGLFKCAFIGCLFSADVRGKVYQHFKQHYREISRAFPDRGQAGKQYVCQFEGCGKVFTEGGNLKTHERIHLGLKPYRCRWPNCTYASEHSSDTIKHIRIRHFQIPRTLKEQREKNIVDDRNPRDYMEVLDDMLAS